MTIKGVKSVDDVIKDLNKNHGDLFSSGRIKPKDTIPFSDPFLNYATQGGIRFGASTEIVGISSSGKTTLAMDLIGNAQKILAKEYEKKKSELEEKLQGKLTPKQKTSVEEELEQLRPRRILMADIEGTYTTRWAQQHGVDVDNLSILRPMAAGSEVMLDYVIDLVATGEFGVVLVDSIGQMISTAENESELGKGNYGGIAKMLTKFYKKITPYVLGNNVAQIMINQTRSDMSGYNQLIRPGGKMNEFAQSLVIYLTPLEMIDESLAKISRKEDAIYAKTTKAQIQKNKAASGDVQNVSFTIVMKEGISKEIGLTDLMIFLGDINQSGAWYEIYDPKTGEVITKVQGKKRIVQYFKDNVETTEELIDYYYEKSKSELGALDE